MNKDLISKFIETKSGNDDSIGIYSKVIGTDPGGQTTSVLMVFDKPGAASVEQAIALYLLDEANTHRSLYTGQNKGKVIVPDLKWLQAPKQATWRDIEYVQTCIASEGLHVPYQALNGSALSQDQIKQAFALGEEADETIVVEVEKAFIVMHWETLA